MAGAWRALVLVAGLAAVVSVAQRSLSYEEIINKALWFFNQGRPGQRLFRLLVAIPPPNLNFTTNIPLNFRIKETVCFSTRFHLHRQPRKCAFREGGEERNCNGTFFMLPQFRLLSFQCTEDPDRERELNRQIPRVRRSAASSDVAPPETDISKLPPAARDLYERTKYDIINNILRNF
ncbi:15 kDa protein B-like [Sus scrofa]|uniref:15 kDa protein B-like n=2 Tax=Sus scrofa TaxID=9823 RepID=A0A4X1T4B8_PIG|nr:15 kDa protein B-like [Sus scrofa]